jgi:pilus assembly protein Flp/PilA
MEKTDMVLQIRLFAAKFMSLVSNEEGQDLVEYALIVALIALAATAGMNSLATAINTTFTNLGTTLTNAA